MIHWTPEKKIKRFWDLCQDCSSSIFGARPPNDAYALATAQMLFGTAAQEGNVELDRQGGVPWSKTDIGAVSVCQLEKGSIQDSIKLMRRRPEIAQRVTAWLFDDPRASTVWMDVISVDNLMWYMMMDDSHKMALAFARLHYFRVTPTPIPGSLDGQAKYWLSYYNCGGVLKHMSEAAALLQFKRNWTKFFRIASQ